MTIHEQMLDISPNFNFDNIQDIDEYVKLDLRLEYVQNNRLDVINRVAQLAAFGVKGQPKLVGYIDRRHYYFEKDDEIK